MLKVCVRLVIYISALSFMQYKSDNFNIQPVDIMLMFIAFILLGTEFHV